MCRQVSSWVEPANPLLIVCILYVLTYIAYEKCVASRPRFANSYARTFIRAYILCSSATEGAEAVVGGFCISVLRLFTSSFVNAEYTLHSCPAVAPWSPALALFAHTNKPEELSRRAFSASRHWAGSQGKEASGSQATPEVECTYIRPLLLR